ncbi:MerR family transcriptional regulator [Latilactobacillus fuchuensis]|uniref:MerR regulatory family protein n=2 Tax=Latilactobacillus fuchuensis TaxID=164393 RepID=A0A2N9DYB2_9LACO|nr:MerR family transcriptional regulator [Latilactobacillus fuchuensis]KRL59623.1 merR regulatory family protein [Latilactobacillus fuchuensis DSM 14340 = JCM 11249]MCP8858145.1 MerR family transcriptional regulator [Latilactobacillus fuchuensis]SPC40127.1 MerR regulatory family protein [Latilactobacillus fuchuensis]
MAEQQYKIGEFGKLVGLSTYTLRYYEEQGLIKPHRDANDVRYFTLEDVKWVGFILHLKGTGMRINELKLYVQLRAQGDSTIKQRRDLLQKTRADAEAEMAELKAHLTVLSHKIDWYDGKVDRTINEDESFENYLQRFDD